MSRRQPDCPERGHSQTRNGQQNAASTRQASGWPAPGSTGSRPAHRAKRLAETTGRVGSAEDDAVRARKPLPHGAPPCCAEAITANSPPPQARRHACPRGEPLVDKRVTSASRHTSAGSIAAGSIATGSIPTGSIPQRIEEPKWPVPPPPLVLRLLVSVGGSESATIRSRTGRTQPRRGPRRPDRDGRVGVTAKSR